MFTISFTVMDGKKAKGLIETQPTDSSHRLLHLSLSNGRFR